MNFSIAKRLAIPLLVALTPTVVLADFSNSQLQIHPQYPGNGPFIVEVSGTWPNDCHPGEQKPVVESFDGHKVVIRYEIVVVHVTCNDRETPYRTLVDMSGAVRETPPLGDTLDIEIDYQGAMLQRTVDLACPQEAGCESLAANLQKPETGLYNSPELTNQGLLLARQGAATGIFPLVYDASGANAWLFSGGQMVENTFFAEILRLSGGDCFGCPPTGAHPQMLPAGYISVLADRPGSLLVKVNDGLFTEYRTSVFGFATFRVGPAGERELVDLSGRWAISENQGTNPPLGDLTDFFPGAFVIELEDIVKANADIQQDGQVSYLVSDLSGNPLGQAVCKGQTDPTNNTNVCEYIDPTDAAQALFLFKQDGPSSMTIVYGRPLGTEGIEPRGKAIRLN